MINVNEVATVNAKMLEKVEDYVNLTTDFTTEDVDDVMCNENGDWIEITINGNCITYYHTGEVNIVLGGEYDLKTINTYKDLMESDEEIWGMYDSIINNLQ